MSAAAMRRAEFVRPITLAIALTIFDEALIYLVLGLVIVFWVGPAAGHGRVECHLRHCNGRG